MEKNFCSGCGSSLQTNDVNKVGYVVDLKRHRVCKRCFDIRNYNLVTDKKAVNQAQVLKEIKAIKQNGQNIFLVVDILSFDVKIFDFLEKIAMTNTLYIIVNKMDIMPKSLKFSRIDKFIKNTLESKNIFVYKILYASAVKKFNIDAIVDEIRSSGNMFNHFIGYANSGKSSLINSILKSVGDKKSKDVTVSSMPGTTISRLEFNLFRSTVYDYPGVYLDGSYQNSLIERDILAMIINKEINPINYSIHTDQSLFIDRAAVFSLKEYRDKKLSIQIYGSKQLKYHKTSSKNIEKQIVSDSFLLSDSYEYIDTEISIPRDEIAYDIVLPDLCRIRTMGEGQVISIKHITGTTPILKKSIISRQRSK